MTPLFSQEPRAGDHDATASSHRAPQASDELRLLHELWQISHYAWTAEATIRRGLSLAAGAQITTTALVEHLGPLLQRGWAEQRDSNTGTGGHEWRLTTRGRDAHAAAQRRELATGT